MRSWGAYLEGHFEDVLELLVAVFCAGHHRYRERKSPLFVLLVGQEAFLGRDKFPRLLGKQKRRLKKEDGTFKSGESAYVRERRRILFPTNYLCGISLVNQSRDDLLRAVVLGSASSHGSTKEPHRH